MSRRSRILTFLLAAFAAAAPAPQPAAAAPPAEHLVLISLDGLRPEFYLDRKWPTPMLQQMAAEGAWAREVDTVFPSVTYPAHTTILTGTLPARHGVPYNSPFEPKGQSGRWYWEASAIRVPTLWDAARDAGLTSASLGWPVSVGAAVDWNLPEIWSLEPGVDDIERLRQVTRPPALLEEIEREATGRLTLRNFHIDHTTRDDRAGDIAAYLLERYRPNLLTVHLIESDHFQHEIGRDGWPVRRAVAAGDRAIAQIVEAAERAGILGKTAFLVTGDHGHVDVHTQLAPNVWLAEEGLMEPRLDRGAWRAAFHTAGASAFLHLADPGDRQAAERARQILESQPPGIRRLFRILDRPELDRLGAAPESALAIAPVPGIHFSSSAEPPALRAAAGATHGYLSDFPEVRTGLVAWGAGIRPGAVAPRLHLADVAALAAALLGIDLETPDGMAPRGFLETAVDGPDH